jgi:hypothetical protein
MYSVIEWKCKLIFCLFYWKRSWDSVVGLATRYGLEGPGIESRWGEIFHTYPDWLRGPPSLLYNGCRVFPGGKGGRGVMLTTHPLLVPRLKSWAIPPCTLWVLLGLLRGSLFYLCFIENVDFFGHHSSFTGTPFCNVNFSLQENISALWMMHVAWHFPSSSVHLQPTTSDAVVYCNNLWEGLDLVLANGLI